MVQVKDNEQGKCFHIAAPDLGTVEHSFASPSLFPSSAPSFGFNTSNPFTTAAASSSSFGSPLFGSIAPPSFGTSFPITQFPWSNNTSAAAANDNACLFSSHNGKACNSSSAFSGDNATFGNTTPATRSCSCGGKSNNPPSATPLFGPASVLPENSKFLAPQETPNPFQVSPFAQFPSNGSTAPASFKFNQKAATFELPINGNSLSAFSGDHATIFNTATTRSCSCDGKLNNPTSENNISSTTPPLFGPTSVLPVTSSFLAPQATPYPFQVHPFAQFPWSGSTALPLYAAIPSNNCYNGFTSLYGVPSSANSNYPYGLPQHIMLMALSPVPTTPLVSRPYSPFATPYDNQLKHCTCCCKCNKANTEPEPKHGFPCNNRGETNPPSSGFSFAPDRQRKITFGTTWPGSSSSNNNNTIPSFNFATPWAVHSPFLVNNKQPCECKYTETVIEGGEKLMSISAMPAFGNQSVEELRWNNCQSQGTRDGNGSGCKKNVAFG